MFILTLRDFIQKNSKLRMLVASQIHVKEGGRGSGHRFLSEAQPGARDPAQTRRTRGEPAQWLRRLRAKEPRHFK